MNGLGVDSEHLKGIVMKTTKTFPQFVVHFDGEQSTPALFDRIESALAVFDEFDGRSVIAIDRNGNNEVVDFAGSPFNPTMR